MFLFVKIHCIFDDKTRLIQYIEKRKIKLLLNNIRMKNLYYLLLALLFFKSVSAQENADQEFIVNDTLAQTVNFFEDTSILNLTLLSDFKKFRKEKFKGKYQPATLIYQLNDTFKLEKNIRIKARGEFRRKQCFFPPIRINWRKTGNVKSEFADYYKMKMVTHCGKSPKFQQYILKEYLCYKLYNTLTDSSFRVKLAKIKYIDTGSKKNDETETFAFFIEDADMLAKRLNAIQIKIDNINMKDVEKNNILLVSLFQFMIGNADWSIAGRHNVKLIKSNDFQKTKVYAVPYDFDYTGMVNAHYAIPDNERLGIKHITDRVYLGLCLPKVDFLPVIDYFKKNKENLYRTVKSFKYLNEKNKVEMVNYLDRFFQIIDSPRFYDDYLIEHCKSYD